MAPTVRMASDGESTLSVGCDLPLASVRTFSWPSQSMAVRLLLRSTPLSSFVSSAIA